MKKYFIILPLLILSTTLASANEPNPSSNGVNCIIKSDKDRYSIGEPVKIIFRIDSFRNGTKIRYPGVWLPPFYGLKIVNAEGKEIKYTGPIPEDIIPYPEVELWKKTYFGTDIMIDFDWYYLQPGSYRLYLEYHGLIDKLEYRMIKSNKIEITIIQEK